VDGRSSSKHDAAPARGTSARDKITLLLGQSPAEEFATLAHELAHEMMHRDERRGSTSKLSRDTEAEAVALVICHAVGLEMAPRLKITFSSTMVTRRYPGTLSLV
jgi:hypothetical protein